eukprot:Rhum_TRINITY_DN14942_c1_g1::Rhum_TRINITY_DN14942_c1_g1_i1::g.126701::m.126701
MGVGVQGVTTGGKRGRKRKARQGKEGGGGREKGREILVVPYFPLSSSLPFPLRLPSPKSSRASHGFPPLLRGFRPRFFSLGVEPAVRRVERRAGSVSLHLGQRDSGSLAAHAVLPIARALCAPLDGAVQAGQVPVGVRRHADVLAVQPRRAVHREEPLLGDGTDAARLRLVAQPVPAPLSGRRVHVPLVVLPAVDVGALRRLLVEPTARHDALRASAVPVGVVGEEAAQRLQPCLVCLHLLPVLCEVREVDVVVVAKDAFVTQRSEQGAIVQVVGHVEPPRVVQHHVEQHQQLHHLLLLLHVRVGARRLGHRGLPDLVKGAAPRGHEGPADGLVARHHRHADHGDDRQQPLLGGRNCSERKGGEGMG